MSFLFKSKKGGTQPGSALPQATRNIHTSDGTTGTTVSNGLTEGVARSLQSPPPNASSDTSISSLNGPGQGSNAPFARRDRAESDLGARPPVVNGQPPPHAALYPWSTRRLNFQNIQQNPFPRYGAAVNANASKDGDIYMMGGLINSSMVRGDLWMCEAGTGNFSCYPIATVSEGPGPRVGHAALLVGNAFIVFGGDTKMDDSDTLDDTLYLLNTTSRQWSRALPSGRRPAGRYGHTLNILGSRIYIFGGQVEGYFFNDLVAFDLNALQSANNQWEVLAQSTGTDDNQPSQLPPARTNHTMISYNDQLYLFGGTNGTQWFNDVWTYDPRMNTWSQLDCIGYIPAPREGHSAALVNDVMYIFGGRTEEGTDLGDLAAFRISSRRWYTFQNMGPSPSARSGHSMTAFGRQIIVLAGEPSSSPRDTLELSMVYILDTAKIRYPNDNPQQQGAVQPSSPTRRPSTEARPGIPSVSSRSMSREGQRGSSADIVRNVNSSRDIQPGAAVSRGIDSPAPGASRLPRASAAQGSAGPPPQTQAPMPRTNGVGPMQNSVRQKQDLGISDVKPIAAESIRGVSDEPQPRASHTRELSKENVRPGREASPGNQGRRTPTQHHQQTINKAKAMEAGEAAPLIMSGGSVSRQRSLRSQRAHGSIDSSEEGVLGRSGSSKHYPDSSADARSLRSIGDEPKSPKLTPHQEALLKELEAAKGRNAWYASELALARKAGYHTTSATSPTFDERAVSQFSDDDRPLIEAFMNMRAELGKMQQTVDQQTASAAKRVAEVEHQRDAAISEAAYARAKLAAHGGSQNSTPQPDAGSESMEHSERQTDISRRLALALAAQAEHKSKMESLASELTSEHRAREIAEESADAAQRRLDEMSQARNPMDLEALRAELHEAQTTARAEATRRAEAENKHKLLLLDKHDLSRKHEESSSRLTDHVASLAALEAALSASTDKAVHFERQMEEEKLHRDTADRKLVQIRGEHEERTRELESTSRRLKDAEELAERHAKEATTHRTALMSGLQRVSSPTDSTDRDSLHDQRLAALQEAADQAHTLARANQEAADAAAQKLRGAEERIAGLEAYQEQTSREGLQIRRQLQAAIRDAQAHHSENRDLKAQLENHQRDANALAVQHGALKDLLGERGINMADARRSPMLDGSPGSRFGTPDQNRMRELEMQLQNSIKAHDETRQAFETREQEADRAYREKLEQLDNDYQSAVHYVKGTEKMLKKMKEELSKYKTQNSQLKTELETTATSPRSLSAADGDKSGWAAERENLLKSIDDMKSQNSSQMARLESNMTSVQRELAGTQAERDHHRSQHEDLVRSTQQNAEELAQLRSENSMLQERAADAEQKVTMLLDQVGQSVGNYRRQSQMAAPPNQHPDLNSIRTPAHNRGESVSTMTDTSQGDEGSTDNRGSLALDNLASELETLRSQWATNASRNYRLSNQFDFERTPTAETHDGSMSEGLSNWRRRLDDEEKTGSSLTPTTKEGAIKEESET